MLSEHTHTLLIFISLSCCLQVLTVCSTLKTLHCLCIISENMTIGYVSKWRSYGALLFSSFVSPASTSSLTLLDDISSMKLFSVMFMYVCRSLFFHVKWWRHLHHSSQRFFIKICEKFPTTQRKAFIIAVSLLQKERYYCLCFSLEIVPFLNILNLIISYSLLHLYLLGDCKKI